MQRSGNRGLPPRIAARWTWGLRLAGLALMLGAVSLVLVFVWPQVKLAWRGVVTEGEVVDTSTITSRENVDEHHRGRLVSRSADVESRRVSVRYALPSGETVTSDLSADLQPEPALGNKVSIIHLAEDRSSAQLHIAGRFWMRLGLVSAFAAAFFAAGMGLARCSFQRSLL